MKDQYRCKYINKRNGFRCRFGRNHKGPHQMELSFSWKYEDHMEVECINCGKKLKYGDLWSDRDFWGCRLMACSEECDRAFCKKNRPSPATIRRKTIYHSER